MTNLDRWRRAGNPIIRQAGIASAANCSPASVSLAKRGFASLSVLAAISMFTKDSRPRDWLTVGQVAGAEPYTPAARI